MERKIGDIFYNVVALSNVNDDIDKNFDKLDDAELKFFNLLKCPEYYEVSLYKAEVTQENGSALYEEIAYFVYRAGREEF